MSGFTMAMILFTAVLSITLLAGLLWLVHHIHRKSVVATEPSEGFHHPEHHCTACGITMETGYTLCGRGIFWQTADAHHFSLFTHIGQALENTISFSMRPAVNAAWRCPRCKLILIDYSRMIKRKP